MDDCPNEAQSKKGTSQENHLARIFHESLAATTDMAVLPGVLGCRPLRRTVLVRLGTNTLRLPGGPPIFMVSRQQFMKYPGYVVPDSTGWARFHIEPNRILDYTCEIFYEEKRRFEKYEQKCYSPRAIKHETIKGWET